MMNYADIVRRFGRTQNHGAMKLFSGDIHAEFKVEQESQSSLIQG